MKGIRTDGKIGLPTEGLWFLRGPQKGPPEAPHGLSGMALADGVSPKGGQNALAPRVRGRPNLSATIRCRDQVPHLGPKEQIGGGQRVRGTMQQGRPNGPVCSLAGGHRFSTSDGGPITDANGFWRLDENGRPIGGTRGPLQGLMRRATRGFLFGWPFVWERRPIREKRARIRQHR